MILRFKNIMKAQVITIGDEILIGQILDSNSSWLAAELTKIGFSISSLISISDEANQIKNTIEQGFKDNDLLLFTGGLGPTKDDITKQVLCEYFNTELVFNNVAYADVVTFLEQRGAEMNSLNKQQAFFPKNATLLRNRQGTAPGIWFEYKGKILICLPGVPWEMKGIFSQVSEGLTQYFSLPHNYYQTVIVSGIGESPLALKLEEWENNLPAHIKLAYLPSPGIVKLRLGIAGTNKANAIHEIQFQIKKLYKFIPEYIVSEHEVLLEEILLKLLINSNKTISTAESCTGGSIAKHITSLPGSSRVFKGSIVAYANETKINLLKVVAHDLEFYGAVSEQVVKQMAEGAKTALNTDYSIATSGIAGPDGGTDDKPVGTVWIAVSGKEETLAKKFIFGNDRKLNIKRSTNVAMNMLIKLMSK